MATSEGMPDSYRWSSHPLASLFHTGTGLEQYIGHARTPWYSEL